MTPGAQGVEADFPHPSLERADPAKGDLQEPSPEATWMETP